MSTATPETRATATHEQTRNPLWELFDPVTLAEPYPTLARWRETGPMATPEGSLILSDYATCHAALRDSVALGNDTLASPAMAEVLPTAEEPVLNSIFFLDNPAHGRQRRLVTRAFTPRITSRFEPWIREIVDGLFAEFLERGEFDGAEDLATRLSLEVIARLLGVPTEDIPMLRTWSSDMALIVELPTLIASFRSAEAFTHDELVRLVESGTEVHAYFADLIHKRRKDLGEDLISNLIRSEEDGRRLTRREVTNVVATVFIAAHESTTNLITNGLLAFSRHQDQLDLLRADPSLAPAAVEEVLRYDGPIVLLGRVAKESKQVNGVDIEKDTVVIPVISAANRDAEKFDDPDSFRIDRATSAGLAFGAGAHYCLGNSLARVEAEVVFQEVAARLRDFHVDEDSLAYRRHVVVRGMERQRVLFST
jgi:cytochrome P450